MLEAAIAAIFHPETGQVLLVKRRDLPVWVLPGGGIDPDETPEDAVIREAIEETGFNVEIIRKVAEYLPTHRWTRRVHLFECAIISGHAVVGEETREINFFSIDQLPKEFFNLHRGWLDDVQKKEQGVIIKPVAASFTNIVGFAVRHPIIFFRYLMINLRQCINS